MQLDPQLRLVTVVGTDAATAYDEHVVSDDEEFSAASLGQDPAMWEEFYAAREDAIADGDEAPAWLAPNDVRVLLFDVDGDGDDDALYRTRRSSVGVRTGSSCDSDSCGHPGRTYYPQEGRIKLRRSGHYVPNQWDYQPLSEVENVTDLLERPFANPIDPIYGDNVPYFLASHNEGDSASYVNLGKSRVSDVDGDGDLDLQLARTIVELTGLTEIDIYQWKADHWRYGMTTMPEYPWQDVDTDALDITAMSGPVVYPEDNADFFAGYRVLLASPPFQRILADVDGDGRVEPIDSVENIDALDYLDVDWSRPFGLHTGDFPYHTTLSSSAHPASFDLGWQCNNGQARVADMEGDGRHDLLVTSEMDLDSGGVGDTAFGVYQRLSLADPTISDRPAARRPRGRRHRGAVGRRLRDERPDLTMGDWNGDGLVDALYPPYSYEGNSHPLVRWNLGNGFGPLEPILIGGRIPATLTQLLGQSVPLDEDDRPVAWDRGTRVADVNSDGRADIIAFRENTETCITDPAELIETTVSPGRTSAARSRSSSTCPPAITSRQA